MGGSGTTKTPMLAARYATEFNTPFLQVADFAAQRERVQHACSAIGRERPMIYSAAVLTCVGHDDVEYRARAAAIGHDPDLLRNYGAAGTVEEAAATLRRYRDAGAERLYLQILDLHDLEHLDLIAAEVAPLLA
jgi:alkanesulfonate monooxygenase SsuD/methylene tetrahydromethanopterin reductase-like flavin-dependent oxidoreductase (luciferase family)